MKWKLPAVIVAISAGLVGLLTGRPTASSGENGSVPGPKNPKAPPWNPPAPGPALAQKEVTGEMTAWAQSLLASPAPMHSLHRRVFGSLPVIGRVEWHTVQARTGKVFPGGLRAVSLYHEGYPDDVG